MDARTRPRPTNLRFSITARPSAATMSRVIVTTVKASVRSSAAIHCVEVNILV
jgi:hypothetical protein